MHIWTKRGIPTALVTGGLLMLGTGIASADEDVNPDKAAKPLDGSLSTPDNIQGNSFSGSLARFDEPVANRGIQVGPPEMTLRLPNAVETLAPVIGANAGALGGDRLIGDTDMPVAVSGDVTDLDYAIPVQISPSAVNGTGSAQVTNILTEDATATGDINTYGIAPLAGPLAVNCSIGATLATSEATCSNANPMTADRVELDGADTVPARRATPAGVADAGRRDLSDAAGTVGSPLSAGGILSNGDSGRFSGNLLDIPSSMIGEVVGKAVSMAGSGGIGSMMSGATGAVGGGSSTGGAGEVRSGRTSVAPAGAKPAIFDVPSEVIAGALAQPTGVSRFIADEPDPMAYLTVDGGMMDGLPVTSMPTLPSLAQDSETTSPLPMLGQFGPAGNLLGGLSGSLPVGNLAGSLPLGELAGGLPVGGMGAGGLPTDSLVRRESVTELPDISDLNSMVDELMGLTNGMAGSVPQVADSVPEVYLSPIPGVSSGVHGLQAAPRRATGQSPLLSGTDPNMMLNADPLAQSTLLAETQALLSALFSGGNLG